MRRRGILEHPALVVAYSVIALQLFQRLLGGLIEAAIELALVDYDLAQDDVAKIVAASAPSSSSSSRSL